MAGAALYVSDMCGNLASTCNWAELAVLVDPKWLPGFFSYIQNGFVLEMGCQK